MKKIISAFFLLVLLHSYLALAQDIAVQPEMQADDGSWAEYKNPYAAELNNLSVPHRTNDEIAAWAARTVANVLSFTEMGYKQELMTNKSAFQQQGWQGYAAFLKESGLFDAMQSDKYSLTTVSSADPIIVNSGTVGDVYGWMLNVPVMTTLIQKDPQGVQHSVSNINSTVTIIIQRASQGGGEDGLLIADWQGKVEQ